MQEIVMYMKATPCNPSRPPLFNIIYIMRNIIGASQRWGHRSSDAA